MKTIAFRKTFPLLAAILAGLLAMPATADVVGSDGWSRATTPGAREAVGYLLLTNKGDEERSLLKITSPIGEVRIHRSTLSAEGVAQMWPVGFVKIPAGGSVRFEPNGYHVMFTDLKKPLKAGDKVPLTVQFNGHEKAFTLMLEVRPLVPAAATPDHSEHKHN